MHLREPVKVSLEKIFVLDNTDEYIFRTVDKKLGIYNTTFNS